MANTLAIISVILLFGCYVLILIAGFKVKRTLKEVNHRLNSMRSDLSCDIYHNFKAEVLTIDGAFVVCRISKSTVYPISWIEYDLNDPDDKEYKRIHAEEIAEKLNERP